MADLKRRVEKLETEEKIKDEGQRGFRIIVTDERFLFEQGWRRKAED